MNVGLRAQRLVDSMILEQPVQNPETNIESLGCTPEINIKFYVSYTSIKERKAQK